jgi:hypothetical protein
LEDTVDNKFEESGPEVAYDEMPEETEENGDITVKQENYRQVVLGQIADGLIPPHPGPPESTDDELARAALSDPAATETNVPRAQPTPWRTIFLLIIAAIALAIVFWK